MGWGGGGGQLREREQEEKGERERACEHYAIAMQAAVHSVWPWGLQEGEGEGERR